MYRFIFPSGNIRIADGKTHVEAFLSLKTPMIPGTTYEVCEEGWNIISIAKHFEDTIANIRRKAKKYGLKYFTKSEDGKAVIGHVELPKTHKRVLVFQIGASGQLVSQYDWEMFLNRKPEHYEKEVEKPAFKGVLYKGKKHKVYLN